METEELTGRELDTAVTERVFEQHGLAPWAYSVDIWRAWEVVEKMRENGYEVTVYTFDLPAGSWGVSFWKPWSASVPRWRTFAQATAMPEAICRAALKALQAE